MEKITRLVSHYYGVYYPLLMNGRGSNEKVIARQMAMLLIKERFPELTLNKIGSHFGKNHATVIHGLNTIKGEIEVLMERKIQYIELKKLVESIDFNLKDDLNNKFCNEIPFRYKLLKKVNS